MSEIPTLTPGANAPITALAGRIVVSHDLTPGIDINLTAFVVNADGKAENDSDVVFYNQPQHPTGIARFVAPKESKGRKQHCIEFDFSRAANDLARIAITLTEDANSHFGNVSGLLANVTTETDEIQLVPHFFRTEKGIIVAELYRRQGTVKVRSVWQGYASGLAGLCQEYGIDVADEASPATSPLSLEKRLEQEAPHLVSLAKAASISLEKHDLQTTVARVCLVLDASGSMHQQYKTGRVQELLDRVLPLALHFDDDGSFEVWAFHNEPKQLPPVTLANIKGYIDHVDGGWRKWYGGANDEPKVMRKVIDFYRADPNASPAYVLFVSDGGVHKNKEIKALMTQAAQYPIFWQFMGLGGRNYGVLEKLDTMTGRMVDNCGFFSVDDLHELPDDQLYDRLLNEFPDWLREATTKGIIR